MNEQTSASDSGVFNIDLVLRQARAYLAFGDQVQSFTERLDNTGPETDWGAAMRQHFAEFRTAIAQSAEDPTVNPELARLWLLMADTWSETASTLGMNAEAVPETVRQTEVWHDFQRTQTDYFNQLRRTATAALDRMEQRLDGLAATGNTVGSLRELYNLWVDCNEESYGQLLRSSAYGQLSGHLLNSLLRCYQTQETQP